MKRNQVLERRRSRQQGQAGGLTASMNFPGSPASLLHTCGDLLCLQLLMSVAFFFFFFTRSEFRKIFARLNSSYLEILCCCIDKSGRFSLCRPTADGAGFLSKTGIFLSIQSNAHVFPGSFQSGFAVLQT